LNKTEEEPKIESNLLLLKRLWIFLRLYRRQIVIILCFVPFIAILNSLQPYLLKAAIDQYTGDNVNAIGILNAGSWVIISILGIAITGSFVLQVNQGFMVQGVGQKFVSDVREKLFVHLQELSLDFFEKNQTGKLLTRLTDDLEALSEALGNGLVGAANDLFLIVGLFAFMLHMNWKMSLVQMFFLLCLVIFFRVFQRIYRNASARSRIHLSQLNSLFQESLWGVLVIKLFNREKELSENFRSVNRSYINANNTYIKADSSFSALIEFMGIFGVLALLALSLGVFDGVTAGELVAFVGYLQMLFQPIQSLSEKFSTFQSAFTSLERMTSLLATCPTLSSATADHYNIDNCRKGNLSCQGVAFRYAPESPYVLSDISFDLEEGQSLAVVGRTGSGKSTLIKLLCRFYDPVKGKIQLGEACLTELDPSALRKKILLVPQRAFLFSGSVRDNLTLDKQIPQEQLEKVSAQTGLLEIVENMPQSFDSELREGGADLSSGQKQLVSLTRALLQDPDILILDEATANLDPYTEALITKVITRILSSGRTVIFIAHRLNLVTQCNQILVMKDGKIIERGKHQELIKQGGYYHNLYGLTASV